MSIIGRRGLLAAALLLAPVVQADGVGAPGADTTIAVPADHATIQEAVDAAGPGDLILISPGVYHEAVNVVTDGLTIRGLDRNEVILDGEFRLDNAIRILGAEGVAIENLTARNYTANGIFWTEVDGYRGSYLTTHRTGEYGIYAFESVNGLIEHSYASGSTLGGLYVGQCFPCNAVVTDMHAEHNGIGYSGTNAGGDLFIVNSAFNDNRVGMVPNSGSYELCYPQREVTIAGNLVHSNNAGDGPAVRFAARLEGNGILVPGGIRNLITRNRVEGHDRTGIALVPFEEQVPRDDQPPEAEWDRPCAAVIDEPPGSAPPGPQLWDPFQNVVAGNVLADNGVADLAVGTLVGDPASLANCFEDNSFTTSAPDDIEALAPCAGEGSGDWDGLLDLDGWIVGASGATAVRGDEGDVPEPPALPGMPGAATAPATPVTGPPEIDLSSIEVPDEPSH